MWARAFFDDATKARTAEAVKTLEAGTSAEVVVTVRGTSGHYRHADYLVGFLLAMATLIAMLYVEMEFPLEAFPVDVFLSFLVGTFLSASVPFVRRLFLSRRFQQEAVQMAARATYVDLGITQTSRRTGILVFVSLFERRVELLADVGVDIAALNPEWEEARGKLAAAVSSESPEPFFEALKLLGVALARVLPRAEDDVNELPDALHSVT
jgi:putative membrane protein